MSSENQAQQTKEESDSLFPSLPIYIISTFFVLLGVEAVLDSVFSLFSDSFRFNFAFLFIPLGIGIIKGRQSSRKWVILLSALFGIFSILGLIVSTRSFIADPPNVSTADFIFSISLFIILLAIFSFCMVTVYRKENMSWFQEKPKSLDQQTVNWIYAIAICGAVISLLSHIYIFTLDKTINNLYKFHVKIAPFDAETKEGLSSTSYMGLERYDSFGNKQKLPKISVGSTGTPEQSILILSGIAADPVSVIVSSEGYENKTVIITRNTDSIIQLPLRKSKVKGDNND